MDVFFDNLQVTHVRGPVLEETHYYPFGLIQQGISCSSVIFGKPSNKLKYNAGTELNNSFELCLYETNYRLLDPQIGKFLKIDPLSESSCFLTPYNYASNNPILRNDPLGLKDSVTTSGEHVLANVTHNDIRITYYKIPKDYWKQQRLYHKILKYIDSKDSEIWQIQQPSLREMMNRVEGIMNFRNRVSEMTYASDLYVWSVFLIPIIAVEGGAMLVYQGGQYLVRVGARYISLQELSLLCRDASHQIWIAGNYALNNVRSSALAALAAIYRNNPAQWEKLMNQSSEMKDLMGPIIKFLESESKKPNGGTLPTIGKKLHL